MVSYLIRDTKLKRSHKEIQIVNPPFFPFNLCGDLNSTRSLYPKRTPVVLTRLQLNPMPFDRSHIIWCRVIVFNVAGHEDLSLARHVRLATFVAIWTVPNHFTWNVHPLFLERVSVEHEEGVLSFARWQEFNWKESLNRYISSCYIMYFKK